MGRPPSPDRDKFIIRLPDGMRDQIKDAAEANNRTMTAEIVARLRVTFDTAGITTPSNDPKEGESLDDQVKMLMKEIENISIGIRSDINNLSAEINVIKEKIGI